MRAFIRFGLLQIFLALLISANLAQGQQTSVVETESAVEVRQFLQSAGLTIKKIARSHWEGTFKDAHQAVFIETDKGVVEVVIFSKETDPFRLRLISQVAKDDRWMARYHYKLEGLATNGAAANIDAAYPLYFTIHKNWLMVTKKPELEQVIKAKIHGWR